MSCANLAREIIEAAAKMISEPNEANRQALFYELTAMLPDMEVESRQEAKQKIRCRLLNSVCDN